MVYPIQAYVAVVDVNGVSPPPQAYVALVDAGGNAVAGSPQAQGRLTLTTAVPVMPSAVSAAATVFYTPYLGSLCPMWNGFRFQPTVFTELSNVLANSSVGKAGPAAGVQNANYDLFVWNDAGTPRLTRGGMWTKSSTVTTPIASPGLVNWAGHGLAVGTPVSFSVAGGNLPTGLVAGTTYYVIAAGYTANVFEVSATVGGAGINFTGTSTGTQTATAGNDTARSQTTENDLQYVQGVLCNLNAITNGPAAGYGTYVGTIRTDSAGVTVTYDPAPAAASGGGLSVFGLWNMYNRIEDVGRSVDNGADYQYTLATIRASRGSATYRCNLIAGLNEEAFLASSFQVISTVAAANARMVTYIGLDSTTAKASSGARGQVMTVVATALGGAAFAELKSKPGLGFHFIAGLELGDGTNANTVSVTSDPSVLSTQWRW